MMGWHWGEGAEWWAMGANMLIWLLILALVIGVVVWVINRSTTARTRGDPAEEVLRRRFAAGEIDSEEYERRLSVLRHQA
jgi:putative membrane protein